MASNDETCEGAVIIGAGIIGVCCALSLQSRGIAVQLVDKNQPGEAASHGNAGVISPWSCVPQCLPGIWKQVPKWLLDPLGPVRLRWQNLAQIIPWTLSFLANTRLDRVKQISDAMDRLMHGNVIAYKKHLDGTGCENLLRESWYVNAFRGKQSANLNDLAWQLRIDHGAPIEVVDRHRLKEIEPAISDEYHGAVLIKDQARALAPGKLCKVLAEKAMRQGAKFTQLDVKKLELNPNGRGVRVVADKTIHTQRVVLCGGIWSQDLLKPLGLNLPLIAERGYHLEFLDPGIEVQNSIMDIEAKIVVSSMESGVRSAGTSEFANVNSAPDFKRADILSPLTKRLLPELNTDKTRRWIGIRPSFPDNLPVIDKLPGMPCYLAFGHSHYGLGMAPKTGEALADLVAGAKSDIDLKPYGINRFAKHRF